MNDIQVPPELHAARARFEELVGVCRPELHRYCSRLVGSAIDGEDVVQDVLAKAYDALSKATSLPPLRPWLLRIAHTTGLDFLRRYDRRFVEPVAEVPEEALPDVTPGPEILRAALSSFVALPIGQRSAVILKDVIGCSLQEIAEATRTTVPAVKASLVRGRARLQEQAKPDVIPWRDRPETPTAHRALLQQYVDFFNAHDWAGLRSFLSEESRLDMVSRATRRGKQVGEYFERYAVMPEVRLALGLIEGRVGIGAFKGPGGGRPSHIILMDWSGLKLSLIRDYIYVPYLTDELDYQPL
jgi:RNA polymerase sigma-70 factor (ECF subfamily)